MNEAAMYRLEGLEPDNLLAFLALLGLLKALEAVDRDRDETDKFLPRVAWDLDHPPLRPSLFLGREATQEELGEAAILGIERVAAAHEFGGDKNLNYTVEQSRSILMREARVATLESRDHVDLLAALMSDGAIKDEKSRAIQPTPLCLLFGQGHQFFLDRLAQVPRQPTPPARGRGRSRTSITAAECLAEALFRPWHRNDPTFSFRWDPEEDVRYALMAGDPTDAAYQTGTQHGANRLAAVGLAALTAAPSMRPGRMSLAVIGGDAKGGFSFAWPVWREPASLAAIRALLAHPGLREPGRLSHLGVEQVFVTRRISVGKFMNFTRARHVTPETSDSKRAQARDGHTTA